VEPVSDDADGAWVAVLIESSDEVDELLDEPLSVAAAPALVEGVGGRRGRSHVSECGAGLSAPAVAGLWPLCPAPPPIGGAGEPWTRYGTTLVDDDA
jgi:hypothetical protein